MIYDSSFAVVTESIVKTFDGSNVVNGIDLAVACGEIFGFLGPNGAGKTTTIAMLTGLLVPDGGRIALLGHAFTPNDRDLKRRIGVVTSDPQLFDSLTGEELLQSLAAIYGVSSDLAASRMAELLSFFDLEPARSQVVAHYSHGMRKKLAVAAALLHEPEILFLDEPFEGMDASAVEATVAILGDLAQRGTTVFLTSHRLELLGRICTSAAVIDRGEIVLSARGDELKHLEKQFLEITGQQKRSLSWLRHGVAP